MKIAVTDASIFIDLYELGGLSWLGALDFEVYTTNLVLNELSEAQLSAVMLVVDQIAELTMTDLETLQMARFPQGLSNADRSLVWYHENLEADLIILFSSDKLLRNWATGKRLEVHGILWILDQLVVQAQITTQEACILLKKLMQINVWLPKSECNQRLNSWCG